jgi:nucleoside-diphosphate-sugar epimerase
MNILVTGATGFLGKYVLSELLSRPEVDKIYVLVRSHRPHSHDKVHAISADLSSPIHLSLKPSEIDHVIHLAASYDLNEGFEVNYMSNVVGTLNLVAALQAIDWNGAFHYASTYAVLAGDWFKDSAEDPLSKLPDKNLAYPHCKAHAEQIVMSSPFPSKIFRLGTLVGDTESGKVERIDGPYYVLNLLLKARSVVSKLRLKKVPVPLDPSCYIPLVPVDVAAKSIVRGVFEKQTKTKKIYGLFNQESISAGEIIESAWNRFRMPGEPRFVKMNPEFLGAIPSSNKFVSLLGDISYPLMRAVLSASTIPKPLFAFSNGVPPLFNPNFREDFGAESVPIFSDFEKEFFNGFCEFVGSDL